MSMERDLPKSHHDHALPSTNKRLCSPSDFGQSRSAPFRQLFAVSSHEPLGITL